MFYTEGKGGRKLELSNFLIIYILIIFGKKFYYCSSYKKLLKYINIIHRKLSLSS